MSTICVRFWAKAIPISNKIIHAFELEAVSTLSSNVFSSGETRTNHLSNKEHARLHINIFN